MIPFINSLVSLAEDKLVQSRAAADALRGDGEAHGLLMDTVLELEDLLVMLRRMADRSREIVHKQAS